LAAEQPLMAELHAAAGVVVHASKRAIGADGRRSVIDKVVGVKTLKDKLSEYIRIAASGETVLVTDRDRVVAELVPPSSTRADLVDDALLADAVRNGWVSASALRDRTPPAGLALAPLATLLDELGADRADR